MIDALSAFLAVLGLWVIAGAAVATLLTLGAVATLNWAWRAVCTRPRRPSWAYGRRKARDFAHARTSVPTGRTEPHCQEPS